MKEALASGVLPMRADLRKALAVATALLFLTVLAITWDRFHGWLEDTAPLAAWLVAGGTAALALATYTLAKRAADEAQAVRDEAKNVADQVAAQREQNEAQWRPVLVPTRERPNLVDSVGHSTTAIWRVDRFRRRSFWNRPDLTKECGCTTSASDAARGGRITVTRFPRQACGRWDMATQVRRHNNAWVGWPPEHRDASTCN